MLHKSSKLWKRSIRKVDKQIFFTSNAKKTSNKTKMKMREVGKELLHIQFLSMYHSENNYAH